MLIALSTSLYFLAHPTAPAHADTTTTAAAQPPTDIAATPLEACAADGVTPSGQVEVQLSGLTNSQPATQVAPIGVQIGLVTIGQTFQTAPAGSPPVYVWLSGTPVNVWLTGLLSTATPATQQIEIMADNSTPVTISNPTACTPGIAPSDFGLVAAPAAPAVSSFTTTCNTDGSASLVLALTNPYSPTPTGYTAASSSTEIDDGVFVADQNGSLLATGGATLVRFVPTNPADPSTMPTQATLAAITLPALASGASYQAYTTGPDGQVSAVLAVPACTPQPPPPPPTTPAPSTSTDSSTPPATSSSPAPSASHSDPTSTDPSSSSVTSAPPSTPAASTPPSTPAQTVLPPLVVSTSPFDVSTSPETSPPPSVTAPSTSTPPVNTSNVVPFPGTFGSSEQPSSEAAVSREPSSSPTVTISGPGAKISIHDTDVAGSPSTIKPVQVLRWHRDAALVVSFDALAICSLVGATVWSARRR